MKFSFQNIIFYFAVLLIVAGSACRSDRNEIPTDPKYVEEINAWHKERIKNLMRPDGWLTLAGLFWLQEGENRFGAQSDNVIVFPSGKSADHMGSFILQQGRVRAQILPGLQVKDDDSTKVTSLELKTDTEGKPTRLHYRSLSWHIIKRGDRYGVRLRDSAHESRLHFKGIERYPVASQWRLQATFAPYVPVKMIKVTNVVGTVQDQECPGALIFTVDDKPYRLDVLSEGEKQPFFVIIADKTSGAETYGGGRFLYADQPDSTGKTIIDFNKAYNPPCSFTPYATCPLPPVQNRLPIAIRAGEKTYQGGTTH